MLKNEAREGDREGACNVALIYEDIHLGARKCIAFPSSLFFILSLSPASLVPRKHSRKDSRLESHSPSLSLPRLRDVRSIGSRESPARLCSPALCVRGSALLSMKPEIIYPRAIRPSFYRTRSSQTPAAGGYDRSEHACG